MSENEFSDLESIYKNCTLCPRECKTDRTAGRFGACRQSDVMRISRAALHFYEEPCISGSNGSGAVFFSGCQLGCVFCQNYAISRGNVGKPVSVEELVNVFFQLKDQGANNINLVTPSHFLPGIRDAVIMAKKRGFDLPFVYNTGSYEKPWAIKSLSGLMDIYLPDLKYFDDNLAKKYSFAGDYFKIASAAIDEMVKQVPKPEFSPDGMLKKGVIVRHLILPGHTKDSMKVIEYLYNKYGDKIYISIMNQYTPGIGTTLSKYPEINRKITKREYTKVVDYAINLGVCNAFIQEGDTAMESFIPQWDLLT